jgi:hypothetical protein
MAHKTLIGGTAYEISGGKTLVNGTAYSIKNGKTLIDGTAYEVGFVEDIVVTVTSHLYAQIDRNAARITINGVVYDGTETVLTIEKGTNIECYVASVSVNSYIEVNGEKVLSGTTGTYTYIATTNCTIAIAKMSNPFGLDGRIVITEQ